MSEPSTSTSIPQTLENDPDLKQVYKRYKRHTAVNKPQTVKKYYSSFHAKEEDIQSSTPRFHSHNDEQPQTVLRTVDGNETVNRTEPTSSSSSSSYEMLMDILVNDTMCSCGCKNTLQEALNQKEKAWSCIKKNKVKKYSWWIPKFFKNAIDGSAESKDMTILLSEDDIIVGSEIEISVEESRMDHEDTD